MLMVSARTSTNTGTAPGKCIRGRYEGIRRHDDFIARCEIAQDGGHVERARAGMGQERALAAEPLFEPSMSARQRVGDIREFRADCRRLVKWDFHDYLFGEALILFR